MGSLFTKSSEAPSGRVKLMMWGDSGSGKTTSALTWPSPACIDFVEKGTDQYRGDFDFGYIQANTPDEVEAAIKELAAGEHPYRTLIFDPFTLYCEAVTEKWLRYFRSLKKDPHYELSGLDYRPIKREIRGLIRKLQALDMNVIVTSRSKTKYVMEWNAKKGKNELVQDGVVEDAMAGIRYEFDLVMNLSTADDGFQWLVEKFRGSRFARLPKQHVFGFGEFYHSFSEFVGRIDAMEADASSTEEEISPHSVLLTKLKAIGLEDRTDKYLRYIISKYELGDASNISVAEVGEQRKILNSLVGKEDRLKEFTAMLDKLNTD